MPSHPPLKRISRSSVVAVGVWLLTACASTTHQPEAPAAPPPLPGPTLPPPPSAPPTPAAQQQAQKEALAAVDQLEAGDEDEARAILRKAMALDPNNKLAISLMRQLTADPVLLLGRDSWPYTVKPGESLSRIAGHFLGDIYLFYALARYNDIKVPRQVAGGQVIRVPGKTPPPDEREVSRPAPKPARPPAGSKTPAPPAPAPAPAAETPPPAPPVAPAAVPSVTPPLAPAPAVVTPPPPPPEPSPGAKAMQAAAAAERAGNLERALAEYRRAASLDQPGAAAKVDAVHKQLVSRYTLQARSAFARQDLDGAIANWNKVLDIDPGNDLARLEKQKALNLKEKIKALK
ncbi:MAG: LysM domain-containing protein [Aquabacterium sp.]